MKKGIRHTGIVVEDLDTAITFYEGMGMKVLTRKEEEWDGKHLKIAKMEDDNQIGLELIEGDWYPHVCFEVEHFVFFGYVLHHRVKSPLEIVFVKDFDGNVVELVRWIA